jgi:DNA modification methylase
MNQIINGDALSVLKDMDSETIQTCITSPPYYGLRDYGTGEWLGGDPDCSHKRDSKQSATTSTGQKALEGAIGDGIYKSECKRCGAQREDQQVGLEETPQEYVESLVKIFREVRRVLKDDGTLWVNLGDSYAGSGKGQTREGSKDKKRGKIEGMKLKNSSLGHIGYKAKDLIGIPWLVAFALQADGWYLRQDIIWSKPNTMPESVTDRCTKAHEYIFLLSKNKNYYFDADAIKEKARTEENGYELRNKRSVWSVATKPYKEAHFATYPPQLIAPAILAGSSLGDTVLDPFFGSGTTGFVAKNHGRKYIGIELNPEYIKIAETRLSQEVLL